MKNKLGIFAVQILYFFIITFLANAATHEFLYRSYHIGFSDWSEISPHVYNWLPILFFAGFIGAGIGLTIMWAVAAFIKSQSKMLATLAALDSIWIAMCWYFAAGNRTPYGMEGIVAPFCFGVLGLVLMVLAVPFILGFREKEKSF